MIRALAVYPPAAAEVLVDNIRLLTHTCKNKCTSENAKCGKVGRVHVSDL